MQPSQTRLERRYMTKPISSYPESERLSVVKRRLAGAGKGIGYASAVEADAKMRGKKPVFRKEVVKED